MQRIGCEKCAHCATAPTTAPVVREPFARSPLPDELEEFVRNNDNYRAVMHTDLRPGGVQQVAMSIGYGRDATNDAVGWEQHANGPTQYFAVIEGYGELFLGESSDEQRARRVPVRPGSKWVVEAGMWHDVRGKLRLYTLYSRQQHPPGQVDVTRADAERREAAAEHRAVN